MIIIETDRLIMREFIENDVKDLLEIFSDPIAMEFFPSTKQLEETKDWLDAQFESYKVHGFGLWAVVLKYSGEFAGYCGLIYQKDVDGKDEIEIAYGLVRKFWNQGYATEAAMSCYKYATHTLNCSRLVSLIDPENVRSRRVVEKVGMKLEKEVERWDKRFQVFAIEES